MPVLSFRIFLSRDAQLGHAKGAAYSDCVGRASNVAFWKFISKTYETQSGYYRRKCR